MVLRSVNGTVNWVIMRLVVNYSCTQILNVLVVNNRKLTIIASHCLNCSHSCDNIAIVIDSL